MSEATRRRWVTLAEVTAVAGVAIAGIGQWNSWREGREEKEQAQAATLAARDRFVVRGVVADGGILLRRDDRHALDGEQVRFPKWLGVPERTTGGHMIELAWFRDALLRLTDGGPDSRTGRLPVLLTMTYHDDAGGDARPRRVTAIYDLLWQTEGRTLRGRSLTLTGFELRDRNGTAARLDAIPPP